MTETAKSTITQFRNCRLLWKHQIIREDLWVRDGKILNPEKLFYLEKSAAHVQVDCGGLIISPGFIDLQINGAFGFDFSQEGDHDIAAGVHKVSKGLLAHGVTSYCPTLVTSPKHVYHHIIPKIQRCNGSEEGAGILGLHLEGPFINVEKKGAHPAEFIRTFDNGIQDILDMYESLDHTSIVTLAAEHDGSSEVISELTKRGVVVSLGHSMANLKQGEKAVQAGASFITHLFNAMLPFHHRDPHLVGLLASNKIPKDQRIFYGMIADGIHTHPAALRIAHRTHPDGLVLVTDAVPAMGMAIGHHQIGQMLVEIKDNRATIAGTNTLCGSIATMNQCVQYFYNNTECNIVEALECATLHPAQVMGIEKDKGTLDYGSDADFVFLDDDLNLKATYIAGNQVWTSQDLKLDIK